MPSVRFEPIGEEIECGEDETVLDAAFREGYSLVHGCREGQCSACKCYLLEGEVSLKPYSTFALSDTEESQGYTLLCRALPDDDLVVELLHFDPDDYRLAHPIRDGRAEVTAVEALTHDITRARAARARAGGLRVHGRGSTSTSWVPGSDGAERRSFSMANLCDGRIELIIKRYTGGRFSGLLEEGAIAPGDELGFTGPYGAMRLKASDRAVLLAAGGSGMAPVLSLLRQLADEGSERRVRFVYGARTQADLFWLDEVAALGGRLVDFRFVPVLSDAEDDAAWEGERGFAHEALGRLLSGDGGLGVEFEAYVCGPPPMVEAAGEMLARRPRPARGAAQLRQVHDGRGGGRPRRAEGGLGRRCRHDHQRLSGAARTQDAAATTPSGASRGSSPPGAARRSTRM